MVEGCPAWQRSRAPSTDCDALIVLLAVVSGLVLWLLAPVFLRHDGSPVGADAPVTGMGALILAAVVADRFGVRLGHPLDVGAIVALVAAGGYLVAARARPSGTPASPARGGRRAGTTAFAPGRHPSLDTPSTA